MQHMHNVIIRQTRPIFKHQRIAVFLSIHVQNLQLEWQYLPYKTRKKSNGFFSPWLMDKKNLSWSFWTDILDFNGSVRYGLTLQFLRYCLKKKGIAKKLTEKKLNNKKKSSLSLRLTSLTTHYSISHSREKEQHEEPLG